MTDETTRRAIDGARARLESFATLEDNYTGEGHKAPTRASINTAMRWAPLWLAWGMGCYASDGGVILESEPDLIEIQPDGSCAIFDRLAEGIEVLGVGVAMIGTRVATRRPYHSVSITEGGWTIEHPPECPDLFNCPLTVTAQQWDRRPAVDGVYRMEDDGSLTDIPASFDLAAEGVFRQVTS